jgi:murein DD-endopeptidase MepM/ murein hydrolase activator NlpD
VVTLALIGSGVGVREVGAYPERSSAIVPAGVHGVPVRAPLPQGSTADPVAPRPAPERSDARLDPGTRFYADTGHLVSGEFLNFYNSTPNAAEVFGLPLTEEFPQQFSSGGTFRVQYFERARMELHPELAPGRQVQLGILAPPAGSDPAFTRLRALPSTAKRLYFPETGHTISNGFLAYWKSRGGLTIFGFPLSEELAEDGVTVQYFERARFEYHKTLEGTPYAVQLSPLGYAALKAAGFNIPMGTLVRFNPPVLAEGHTAAVEVAAGPGVNVSGEYQGRRLVFKHEPDRGVAWAMLGSVALGDLGPRPVTINLENGDGGRRTVTRTLQVVRYPFPSEMIYFDEETSALLDPALTTKERETLDAIFAGRTPEQMWDGAFGMPLEGSIRVTSAFATRRCYNCAAGSTPTSYHGGLDMGAAEGTRVHAPAAGKVVFAGKLAVRGNAVIIDHGLGVFSLFAHNSRLIAAVGQVVKKGEVVSLSGNTGLSNGPHLHWELHVSGPAVDPLEWVKRPMP